MKLKGERTSYWNEEQTSSRTGPRCLVTLYPSDKKKTHGVENKFWATLVICLEHCIQRISEHLMLDEFILIDVDIR